MDSQESRMTRQSANTSGYFASTFPVSGRDMYSLKKPEILLYTRVSKVELQARATLAVPKEESKKKALECSVTSPHPQDRHKQTNNSHVLSYFRLIITSYSVLPYL